MHVCNGKSQTADRLQHFAFIAGKATDKIFTIIAVVRIECFAWRE